MAHPLRQRVGRELVKALLRPMVQWKPLTAPEDGFTIILGVPWDLRELLEVNLRFVAQTDLRHLRAMHVVFDRRSRDGMAQLASCAKAAYPQLPLQFYHYPPCSGAMIEKVNVSTFYNSMNTVLALGRCTTRYAVLHDFDLYPLLPHYFTDIVDTMRRRDLRFCGLELTPFDGLTAHDALLGTWALGIDVPWLRANWTPIDCFHKIAKVNGRAVNLDPYSWIQSRTPQRGLAGTIDGSACCHVKNLCSTYLRFITGRWAKIVWRLHYLWYLQDVSGDATAFDQAQHVMQNADSPRIVVGGHNCDFTDTDPTCANVLRDELYRMERALHGSVRPRVERYVDTFEAFLTRHNAVAA